VQVSLPPTALIVLATLPLACQVVSGLNGFKVDDRSAAASGTATSSAASVGGASGTTTGTGGMGGAATGSSTSASTGTGGGLPCVFFAVAAGPSHTCAIKSDQTLWCWGTNTMGELGDGTTADHPKPTQVPKLVNVTRVALGKSFTCALSDGALVCWGKNDLGQLGIGSTEVKKTPTPVVLPSAASALAVAAGDAHAFAILTNKKVYCWGSNKSGQLGLGTMNATSLEPAPVTLKFDVDASSASAIVGGGAHSCARDVQNVASCWGANASGQLGNGSTKTEWSPVIASSYIESLAGGANHTCALATEGSVQCWGLGSFGQLGDGNKTSSSFPIAVPGLMKKCTAISAGKGNHSCAIQKDGTLWCWGDNFFGQLGIGTHGDVEVTPKQVVALGADVATVAAGAMHTCAIRSSDGKLFCWGLNSGGQLGDGSTMLANAPKPVVCP
jgi:alpha-tubulin suppressor-like RCC1 family protein